MKMSFKVSLLKLWYYFIALIIIVAFLYNSYRYPLQINAASTSPTYSQTPLILKIGKYLIFSALYFIIIFSRFYLSPLIKVGNSRQITSFLIVLFLTFFPIFIGVINKSVPTLETGFFFLIAFIFHLYRPFPIPVDNLVRLLKWLTIIAILYNFIQVTLFFLIGRLPALAYPNSISVRFGGVLDDPNGFGIMLSLFVGFSFTYFKGFLRVIILLGLASSLLLTQSLTALAANTLAVFLVLMGYTIYTFKASKNLLWSIIMLLLVVLSILLYFFEEIISFIQLFLLLKAGSIEGHAESFDVLFESNAFHWLGFLSMNGFSETGYINLIVNLGILYILLYLSYGFAAIYKCFIIFVKSNHNRFIRSIALAALLYLITVYLGMLNLPLEQVFPINAITTFFLGLFNTHYADFKNELEHCKSDEQHNKHH